jgi:hypothetical protein
MQIREVIKMVNQLMADGVIEHYAIGGAWQRFQHQILDGPP